ncbi:MAG: tetratricopeptide repeat protein [Terriglobales bacterium]
MFLLLICEISVLAQNSNAPASTSPIESALRKHDYQHALQLAQSAVQQSPKNPKLWALEGIALSGLGRRHAALAAYNRALAISPEYLPALEGAAEVEYQAESNRALPLLERVVKLRPGDPTANAMLGVLNYKQHDCVSAIEHFRASWQLISSQPAALAQYGTCLMNLDKAEDAVTVFKQLLAVRPDDSHSRYNLAVVQLAAHSAKDALETLQPLLVVSPIDADVLDLASSAYEESGDTPKAVALLRQAIVLDPKKIKYYVDFAAISFTHQSFQIGVDMVDVGLKENPTAAELFVARGVLLIQLGEYQKAETDFERANQLDPKQTSGAVAEGLAQMQQSNLDQALTTVRGRLKDHPDDAFLHYLEANILFQKGADPGTAEFKDAIAAASRAEQLRADFVLAYDLLGNLYLKSGEIDKSIVQSRRALAQNASDQEALYHLIQALRQGGKDKEELPTLVKRLAILRQQARQAEASGNRYRLYESSQPTQP